MLEWSDFSKIMQQWQNPVDQTAWRKTSHSEITTSPCWHQQLHIFCNAFIHSIRVRHKGYLEVLLLIPQYIQSYLKTRDAMQWDTIFYFTRLGWGIHSSGWEWRMGNEEGVPIYWRSSSKKKASWRFWKSTNMLLLSNIANPIYSFPVLPNCQLTLLCFLLVLFLLWKFLSSLSFRLDSFIVLILGLNPKFVQKLHLNLKPNDHLPLQYFMYLSR